MEARPTTLTRARRLRREMSPPETWLWQRLRDKRLLGLKFRRQHPIGPWIVDFYCVALRLAVEVDGAFHSEGDGPERDRQRDAWLAGQGIRVIRFRAADVMQRMNQVLASIAAEAGVSRIGPEARRSPP